MLLLIILISREMNSIRHDIFNKRSYVAGVNEPLLGERYKINYLEYFYKISRRVKSQNGHNQNNDY